MSLERTPLYRHARRGRRADGRFRRLGNAAALRLADRRTQRGAPRRRHVRRVAHDDHRSRGRRANAFLRHLTANDVERLTEPGRAQYGVLLNDAGCVVDDLIVYRRANGYRAVVNASTRAKVLRWFADHACPFDVKIDQRADLAMIAIQGPQAIETFERVTGHRRRRGHEAVQRTRTRRMDGRAHRLHRRRRRRSDAARRRRYRAVGAARAPPVSRMRTRGARHAAPRSRASIYTVRTWTRRTTRSNRISRGPSRGIRRCAISSAALRSKRATRRALRSKLTGVVLEAKGVMRHGQRIITNSGEGEITSGIFSPTLGYSIALARLPRAATGAAQVDIRGKLLPCRIVRPPFVRNGAGSSNDDENLRSVDERVSDRAALREIPRVGAARGRRHRHRRHQ